MAENVVLSVQLSGAEAALAQLTQLDNVLKSIKANHNVKINVNARSLINASEASLNLAAGLDHVEEHAKSIGTVGAKSINTAGESLKKGSRNAESFNTGLGNVVLTMAKFRLASGAINLVTNGFKEAFAEMKRVDTEMVTIRKVTGFTADEMERLSKNAYSLASKYGRTASEVMAGKSVFARAGYTTQIEQLGELSLLLQNVGDLQAKDAARFLIATDAAYKYAGSQKKLMAVVDGLNEITNRNATDMQKMTEGMTVAGSVFAESGESIEMYAALLGTATADTQRSGAEIARGLRTILMNLRQIRGETEDGELIDGESIAAAAKALKDYAGISTMENGQLRKASDVLAELASKWNTLTETQKAAISEAVAGKRQANILMTLMGDWETVEKMMADYANGAGSALAENEIYLDSWEAKTKELKASWTELVNTIADTELIKEGFDVVSTGIKVVNETLSPEFTPSADLEGRDYAASSKAIYLGSDLSKARENYEQNYDAAALLASMNEVIRTGQEYYNTLQEMKKAGSELLNSEQSFVDAFDAVQNGVENSQNAVELYGYAAAASSLAAGESAEDAANKANEAMERLAENLDSLPTRKDISINISVNTSIGSSSDSSLPDFVTDSANFVYSFASMLGLASGTDSAPGGPALVNEKGPEMISANGLAWIAGGGKPTVTMLPKGATVLTAEETKRALGGKKYNNLSAFGEGTQHWTCPVCGTVNGTNRRYCKSCNFDLYSNAVDPITGDFYYDPVAGGSRIYSETNQARDDELYGNLGPLENAGTIDESNRNSSSVQGEGVPWPDDWAYQMDPITGLPIYGTEMYDILSPGTIDESKRSSSSFQGEGVPWTSKDQFSAGNLPNGNVAGAFVDAWNRIVDEARNQGGFVQNTVYRPLSSGDILGEGTFSGNTNTHYKVKYCPVCGTANPAHGSRCVACGYQFNGEGNSGKGSSGEGSSGSGYYVTQSVPSGPNFKTLEDELSKLLKNLDAQAKLAENEEDYIKAMMIYGEAQSAIADLLDLYRENGYANDSDEVLRLANLGYDYAAKQLGGYDKLQQNLIDALNALTESTDDANELAERREAVEKAREALANAEKQRTVRVFNPVTGQWEWVANAADVTKAQENLKNAEEALRKEELSQAVKSIKNAKPEELGDMTLSPAILDALLNGSPEQQTAFLRALGAASGGADWLASSEAKTAWNQGNNIGTQYNLNGITLTEEQASGMTIKQLIATLQGLKIM